jgi:membrane protein YqaA with SNARE-associated domain
LVDWGQWGLFLSAFLSATLLPGSSEVLLAGLLISGTNTEMTLWFWATSGNVLGSSFNRELGAGILRGRGAKWLGATEERWLQAEAWFQKYGQWSLLMAWLPVIGDPLTIAAGALGISRFRFLILVTLGKGTRYWIIIYLIKFSEIT